MFAPELNARTMAKCCLAGFGAGVAGLVALVAIPSWIDYRKGVRVWRR